MVYTVRPRSQTPESLRTSPTERLDLPLLSLYFSSVLPICPPPPLSFLPLCPSYPSVLPTPLHISISLSALLPTLHLISVLSVLPCPLSSALSHCLLHRFPSSLLRLPSSPSSLLLPLHLFLPVVLSPLFFFFPLSSPPLPPLPAPASPPDFSTPPHPTSPPSPTFSNTPLRHTSPPSFLRHTSLLHSSPTPFPLFRFFSLGPQTSSLSPLFLLSSPHSPPPFFTCTPRLTYHPF